MKFIKSSWDYDSGYSIVIMQHLGKKFIGIAKINPEDPNPKSEYFGGMCAEIKATIKALKYERKLLKNKSDMALDFVKSLECYKDFSKDDPAAKLVYKQLQKRIDKVNDITDEINSLYKELDLLVHRRNIVLKAMDRKKKMSKEEK